MRRAEDEREAKTPPHVVIVLASFAVGGAERQACLLAKWLYERGEVRVSVVGLRGGGPFADWLAREGVAHRVLGSDAGVGVWWRWWRGLRNMRPDVLVAFTNLPNVVCGVLWRWTGARNCVWGQRDEGRGRLDHWLVRRTAARWTPRFVSNSEPGGRFLVERLGVLPRRVRVIANGVSLPEPRLSRAAWREQLGVGLEQPMVVMVANLHRNKDHATLIQAWRGVIDRSPVAPMLVLAGRHDDTAAAIRAQVAREGLGGSVAFAGEVEDVAGLLTSADVAVFSSIGEGTPNAVLEAMAAGNPVVASDLPGVREAMRDTLPEGGSLVPPGDAEAFAEALSRWLIASEVRHMARRRNMQSVAERYGIDAMGRAFLEEMTYVANTKKRNSNRFIPL